VSEGQGIDPRLFRPRRPEQFEALYAGSPRWDVGRPQPAFVALAERGLRARFLVWNALELTDDRHSGRPWLRPGLAGQHDPRRSR
jgi:hypothetical protein